MIKEAKRKEPVRTSPERSASGDEPSRADSRGFGEVHDGNVHGPGVFRRRR
jgi:hypothetical protein